MGRKKRKKGGGHTYLAWRGAFDEGGDGGDVVGGHCEPTREGLLEVGFYAARGGVEKGMWLLEPKLLFTLGQGRITTFTDYQTNEMLCCYKRHLEFKRRQRHSPR